MPAATQSPADVEPDGIVTVAGRVAAAVFELESDIRAPLAPAGAVRVILQFDPLGEVNTVELHQKPLKPGVCPMVTVPPLVLVGRGVPEVSLLAPLVSWTDEDRLVVDPDNVRYKTATTPLEIAEEVRPRSTQVDIPGAV